MKNPCKECKDRHQFCHDHCDKYKAWLTEERKKKEWLKSKTHNPHAENKDKFLRSVKKGSHSYKTIYKKGKRQ